MKKVFGPGEMGMSIFCLQPSRPIFCTTKNEDGSDHVAPFGWCTPASQYPPMLTLAIAHTPRRSQSLINIERDGEFVINLPDMTLTDELVRSSYDTRLGENKFERSGLTRLPSKVVRPCGIAECRAHLECRVRSIEYPGDHAVILADIVYACYDENAFGGNMLIDVRNYRPVIHLQNFNVKEAASQLHLFLKADAAEAVQVPFPRKEDF